MCLELVLFGSVNYVAVDYKCFVYYIGCMLIAKCRLQSRIYIYVIVIFYYLHKTYILQENVFCLHSSSSVCGCCEILRHRQ